SLSQRQTYFAPVNSWWRRRVPPPGPHNLLHKAFIAIVGKPTFHI
ncbi:uncharacterized protein METZ01_LOCUS105674, partial [marine metagenome]